MKNKNGNILLLEEDRELGNVIKNILEADGHNVYLYHNIEDVPAFSKNEKISLAILNSCHSEIVCDTLFNSIKEKTSPKDLKIMITASDIPTISEYNYYQKNKIFFLNKYSSPLKLQEKVSLIISQTGG